MSRASQAIANVVRLIAAHLEEADLLVARPWQHTTSGCSFDSHRRPRRDQPRQLEEEHQVVEREAFQLGNTRVAVAVAIPAVAEGS